MPLPKEEQQTLDTAATEAKAEYEHLTPEVREAIETWWTKNYEGAGHKRLGRVVLGTFAPKES